MKGGYQIIDLRNLSLELSNSTGNITDVDILNQLRNLRAYIEKGHTFSKPLDNALKCIIVRYRDDKNGEKLEACQWANIEVSNDSLTYEIKTKNLMIEVVFEEKTDEYDNKYYDIKTVKYLFNHNEIIEGDLIVSGNAKIFENIVDKDEHSRFIEGDIECVDDTNIDEIYGKWSLSGTHLLLVLCFSIEDAVTWSTGAISKDIELPSWIADKIVPVFSSQVVPYVQIIAGDESGSSSQTLQISLRKISTRLYIQLAGVTTTAKRYARVQFDLLIDNE